MLTSHKKISTKMHKKVAKPLKSRITKKPLRTEKRAKTFKKGKL